MNVMKSNALIGLRLSAQNISLTPPSFSDVQEAQANNSSLTKIQKLKEKQAIQQQNHDKPQKAWLKGIFAGLSAGFFFVAGMFTKSFLQHREIKENFEGILAFNIKSLGNKLLLDVLGEETADRAIKESGILESFSEEITNPEFTLTLKAYRRIIEACWSIESERVLEKYTDMIYGLMQKSQQDKQEIIQRLINIIDSKTNSTDSSHTSSTNQPLVTRLRNLLKDENKSEQDFQNELRLIIRACIQINDQKSTEEIKENLEKIYKRG